MNIARAASAGSSIFINWRCINGISISVRPNAVRCAATCSDSFSARRISPAARTPFDSRDMLIMSAIW
ncbi:hypothetical protein BamIOP4010DRAFT_4087 [Burkholderia ambifaria IOP40-10]|uniref:Uncharacterized protein n=1 Tax=Burkholderia ambifaria IOP40-10 TaxID=396596 RepID=B1FJ76_9BURK|nr:hypothetical protein BamIOP4010DRAFT_4087 [Burkholderia ambifaria IOP40-10]